MDNCIICHKPIEKNQMVIEGKKPEYFSRKQGKMHASCYKIFKVFMNRGAWSPVTFFVIGIVLMVVILIPGLITEEMILIATSFIVLGINIVVSVIWYWLMYLKTKKECQIREPIKKKDDLSEYDADFRIQEQDYVIQEESFDYYHENIDASQFEEEELKTDVRWALNIFGLNSDFNLQQLNERFSELTNIYQPSFNNNYDTAKIKELLKANNILRKTKKS